VNGSCETTETQVERLLGQALNTFDLPEGLADRLATALTHVSSLSSAHHSAALHRETHRHTYLLADGTVLTLWELVHTTGSAGHELHELYMAEADARLAASQLLGPDPAPETPTESAPPSETLTISASALPRLYVPEDSADHARRVLRRAENADRPGERTARRLREAFAHHIAQVFVHEAHGGYVSGCMMYEHAFLLVDGSELSLWEVEHTATPDGRHMCEVYADEHAARRAVERRTHVPGEAGPVCGS
jgi:hypothetical protein